MNESVGIIIQARMGSSRLPGKVLKPIGEMVLLDHILGRLSNLRHLVKIVIATSNQSQDDIIENYCSERSVSCFRGSEHDVLDRYLHCAGKFNFQQIVRLTGDNPFTDIEELDSLIEKHLQEKNDYTHSFGELPIGVGAEIFTFRALELSAKNAEKANQREHVNEFIQENPEEFRIGVLRVAPAKIAKDVRLTVDTEEDYVKACKIVESNSGRWLATEELIRICSESV